MASNPAASNTRPSRPMLSFTGTLSCWVRENALPSRTESTDDTPQSVCNEPRCVADPKLLPSFSRPVILREPRATEGSRLAQRETRPWFDTRPFAKAQAAAHHERVGWPQLG